MRFLISLIVVKIFYVQFSYSDYCLSKIESAKIGEKCSNQLKKLCGRHDLLLKFWDSSSRQIHSGLTATDNQDLGNFDLCRSIDANFDDIHILGKYCPLQWATLVPNKFLEEFVALLEEYNPPNSVGFKENFEVETFVNNIVDSGAGLDENITIIGSVCIPDACTPEEFTEVFNPYILPVVYSIQNASTNCFTKEAQHMSLPEIIMTIVICVILLIVVCATIFHVWLHIRNEDEPHDLIKAFSVLHNGRKLIAISGGNPEQIQCIHGLKFLSMLWVIAGHTYATERATPSFSKDFVKEWSSLLYSQYIQAAHYAVDTFFFLSGLLLAYGYLKQMKGVGAIQQMKAIPLMIVHRYLRLTPAITALYFISISFFKTLGDGPLWNTMLNLCNDMCRKYWWRYFLYIQNYYDFSEICYIQTWYLSADMQMFIVAPLVLIPATIFFRKKLKLVISALLGLIMFCVGLTIAIRYIVEDYTNEYDTHSRLSNYLVGIIGGIIMHNLRGKDIKITKIMNLLAWILTLAVMLFLILYMHDVVEYPTREKTYFFDALQKPIWSACILWIVFSCHHGYGGVINNFLSSPCFQIGSRLSYCMYVVHVMVIYYNLGSIRTYQYFNDYTLLYVLCGNVVFSLIISTLWTLAFEAPMIILNKMLLGKFESSRK